jgi:hypothetical protein
MERGFCGKQGIDGARKGGVMAGEVKDVGTNKI